jgi:hypothetical protein
MIEPLQMAVVVSKKSKPMVLTIEVVLKARLCGLQILQMEVL